MSADVLADAERRIDDLRAFESEYRSRIRAYLQGLLRDLDAGSGPAFDPADFALVPVFLMREGLNASPSVAVDCKHCKWRCTSDPSLFSALSSAQGHECLVKLT